MVSSVSVESLRHVTTAQRNALDPVQNGTLIYNPTTGRIENTADTGSTWQTVANFDEITMQNAFDGGNEILQGANIFTVKSNNTTPPGVDFKHELTGVALQDTFKITTESKTDTGALKLSTALKYTTTNAVDATFSQDVLLQAWSFNVLTDVLHFVGTERTLNVAPGFRVDGDGVVSPTFFLRNPNDTADDETLFKIISECKASTSQVKDHTVINHFVVDEINATFSTETRFNGWFNGTQTVWLEVKGDTQQVQMFTNFSNNQNDATYVTSIDIEDFIFAKAQMISTVAPSAVTGSCILRTGIADEAIEVGSIVTVSTTTDYRMVNHPVAGDDKGTGVATTAAAGAGDPFLYCVSGTVPVRMDNNVAVTRSNLIGPTSNGASSPGRANVINPPSTSQVMGIAWESVASSPTGALVRMSVNFSSAN